MGRREFDRFFIHTKIGANRKLRRLKPAERWCYVAGVLSIAAESPIRGVLLVTAQVAATEEDISHAAGVSITVARSTMAKLRELHMLVIDPDTGVEAIHDWDEWQVDPRPDPTAARRMALHRDPDLRLAVRQRDGDQCRYCGITVKWEDRRSPAGGTYDHVDPTGDNSPENLVVACRGCNASKGSRKPHEAGISLRPIQIGSKSDLGHRLTPVQTEVEEEAEVEGEVSA